VDKVWSSSRAGTSYFGGTKLAGRRNASITQRPRFPARRFPSLGRAAKREHVDADVPVPDPYTRLTPEIRSPGSRPATQWPSRQHFSKIQRRGPRQPLLSCCTDSQAHVDNSAASCARPCYPRCRERTSAKDLTPCTSPTVPLPSWYDDPAPVASEHIRSQPVTYNPVHSGCADSPNTVGHSLC